MKYLLDTCVLSELVKPIPHLAVVEWLTAVSSDSLFISVITIGELRKGVVKLPESKKKVRLTLWLTTLMDEYRDRILPIDMTVSEQWGMMQATAEQAGTPVAVIDGLIAATALTHHLTVVTRNEQDFRPSKVSLFNPWTLSTR